MFGLSKALHMLGRFSPAYIAVILIVSSACKRKESKTEGGDSNDTVASTEFDSGGGQSGGGTGDSGSGDSGAPVLTPPSSYIDTNDSSSHFCKSTTSDRGHLQQRA